MSECRFKETDRVGLYIMVFIIMMNTCNQAKTKVECPHAEVVEVESVE